MLEPFAKKKKSTQDIFGPDYKYVSAGTDCPSLGVIKTHRKNLHIMENEYNKKRIVLKGHDLAYTNLEGV